MMSVIEINNLTKNYGDNKGIFNLSFNIEKGEVVAFLGSNGAGKTTTIRHLMGFIKAQEGTVKIMGLDCFEQESTIQKQIGYLAGEIAFLDESMTAEEYIKFMLELKKITSIKKVKELIEYFELDIKTRIRKMSKGTKQKLALVVTFMQDAPILILDEPTSGLDPIMQYKFVDLILKEKSEGKTILMSSHMFEEIEHTCDRVLCIKDGRIIANKKIGELIQNRRKYYKVLFSSVDEAIRYTEHTSENCIRKNAMISLMLERDIKSFLQELCEFDVIDISDRSQTLEELFLQYYRGDEK